jgi:hypothetical protein
MTAHRVKVKDELVLKRIAAKIGYRKREAAIWVRPKLHLTGLNWSGGSRSQYFAYRLEDGATHDSDHANMPAPWDNRFEGAEILIPPGVVIVQHGHFMGKTATMYVYVRPDDAAKVLTK